MLGILKRQESHKLLVKLVGPLLFSLGAFYLIFQALSGDRGVYALLREERRLEALNKELVIVEKERKTLEHRVRLMSSDSLDLDLLDEQVRNVLGLSNEDELIIPLANPGANNTPQTPAK